MIPLKTPAEIERMRRASKIVAEILFELAEVVKPGVTTGYLNAVAEKEIRRRGAVSAFKGYKPFDDDLPFPGVICTSVNEQVVHGIPSERVVLKQGDIVSIDLGVICEGYCGDAATTLPVGKIRKEARRLLQVTEQSLWEGILRCRQPFRLHDISAAVQCNAESHGFSVVRKYFGHGIGKAMHEEPAVPNFGEPGTGPRLEPGMVLAIEPMINEGVADTEVLDDRWTVTTADGKLSAHFEHTVAITERGLEVLSRL
ncbi:MAG: type I methionyl aminopeptidase [Candidatus Riflebacteria bacterium]|nr:type I methionyl aminopeptidase [Candidatus Riflebacteria bacterium]